GVTRFRYEATSPSSSYQPGTLSVDFLAFDGTTGAGWQDNGGNAGSASADDRALTVEGPTATLTDPQPGSGIDVHKLNGRNYVDVAFPTAPVDHTIDTTSITDLAPEFRLSGAGLGTVTIDNSQAPTLVPATGAYRYWLNGTFAASGDVTLTLLAGSWSFVPTTLPSTPNAAQALADVSFVDVTFPTPPTGYAIDSGSINGNEFTIGNAAGATMPTIASVMPLQKGKYRFFLTGGLPTGLITVHFAANTWNTTAATGYSNLASDKTFTVLGPTADLVNPTDGS